MAAVNGKGASLIAATAHEVVSTVRIVDRESRVEHRWYAGRLSCDGRSTPEECLAEEILAQGSPLGLLCSASIEVALSNSNRFSRTSRLLLPSDVCKPEGFILCLPRRVMHAIISELGMSRPRPDGPAVVGFCMAAWGQDCLLYAEDTMGRRPVGRAPGSSREWLMRGATLRSGAGAANFIFIEDVNRSERPSERPTADR